MNGKQTSKKKTQKKKRESNNIIFINGVWDVLHAGHISFLHFCEEVKKERSAELWLGIDEDTKVQKDKGVNRPYFSLEERVDMIEKLGIVDKIIPFKSNEELEEIIKDTRPSLLIKDEQWKGKVVGEKYVEQVIFFSPTIKVSTSEIERRILQVGQ